MAEVTLSVFGESVADVLSVFREYAENLLAEEVENAPLEDEADALEIPLRPDDLQTVNED